MIENQTVSQHCNHMHMVLYNQLQKNEVQGLSSHQYTWYNDIPSVSLCFYTFQTYFILK